MASRRNRPINLPAPYLKRVWLDPSRVTDRATYPFCLPLLRDDFELSFDRAITIIVGENGTGKSTLLEGIAVLAGYDEAGGRSSTSEGGSDTHHLLPQTVGFAEFIIGPAGAGPVGSTHPTAPHSTIAA
jgi:predicted ATPase